MTVYHRGEPGVQCPPLYALRLDQVNFLTLSSAGGRQDRARGDEASDTTMLGFS